MEYQLGTPSPLNYGYQYLIRKMSVLGGKTNACGSIWEGVVAYAPGIRSLDHGAWGAMVNSANASSIWS